MRKPKRVAIVEKPPRTPHGTPDRKLLRRILGTDMVGSGYGAWKPWQVPANRLSIDDVIAGLTARQNAPRILAASADRCPYFRARQWVALAVERAALAGKVAAHQPAVLDGATDAIDEMGDLLSALDRFVSGDAERCADGVSHDVMGFSPSDFSTGVQVQTERRERALRLATQLRSILAEELSEVPAKRARLMNNQPDEYRIAFVTALAMGWLQLTGQPAGNRGLFLEFVAAAWIDAAPAIPGADSSDVSWDRPIRTALHRLKKSSAAET